jgi:spermidine/putrescine ABC transporter ATP-binding subunit
VFELVVDVRLEKVTKRFGKTIAVDSVDLYIKKGELFGIIGPSGCGKTTTLRLIAGLEFPDEGRIFFGEKDVTFSKPYERNTAMVFQNYALWPHMTVYENIAYGLRLKKLTENEVRRRVKQVLELTKLEGLENRYPTQLSGGQQQRVALARALVVEPEVLLLDEPLSNLDAKLRVEMRGELRNIIKTTGITAIYVTHDQEEAMSICDRIAIMNKGRVIQVGDPMELYFNPKSFFVATFMGKSNVLKGMIKETDPMFVKLDGLQLRLDRKIDDKLIGKPVYVVIRPENIKIVRENIDYTENIIEGEITNISFLGSHYLLSINIDSIVLQAYAEASERLSQGDKVKVRIDPKDILIFKEQD